jgi:thiol-disulfide isomerase/thioredoxin
MKRNSLLFITSLVVLMSATFNLYGQARYELKGRINGVTSGTISISTFDDNNRTIKTIDSGAIVNNSFELRGEIESPQMVDVKIMPGDWRFRFIIENRKITINADTLNAQHLDYTKYGGGKFATITNFMVTGSRNFDDWMSYQKDPKQKEFDRDELALEKQFKAAEGNDSALDKANSRAALVSGTFRTWQKNYISNYASQHPTSVAGVYMLYDFYTWLPDERVTVLNTMLPMFTGEALSSRYFATLSDVSAKLNAVQPGSAAPDFTLLKRDSTSFNLTAFAKGKYTMIDFWASWCAPCREMIPYWKTVYQKYHDKGFQIISVSADSRYKDWVKYMDVVKMPWEQVIDDFKTKSQRLSKVMNLYQIPHIPYYLLLDKNGKILASTSDGTIIGDQLKKIYGE